MPLPNILGTSTSVTPSTTGGLPNILGDTSPAPKSLTPRETGLPNILQTSAATTTPTYWAGTVNGTSFGPSKLLDVSGKPFLDYRGSTDPATTTDKTRVSTTFDPTATSTMKSSNFYNERMSENDSSTIKKQMGGTYSDELDHKISLELSGSNDVSNLQVSPGRIGGEAAKLDKLENSLAKDVASGKKTLFQAQKELAIAKGFTVPVTGEGLDMSKIGKVDLTNIPIQMNNEKVDMKPFIQMEEQTLKATSDELKNTSDQIDSLKSWLDTNKNDLDTKTYNQNVDTYNSLVKDYKPKADSYNKMYSDYTTKVAGYNADVSLANLYPGETISQGTPEVTKKSGFIKDGLTWLGKELNMLPSYTGDTMADREGRGLEAQTQEYMNAHPEQINPGDYFIEGGSFGNVHANPNVKLPPPSTPQQYAAYAIGQIFIMTVATPFIEGAFASTLGTIPEIAGAVNTLNKYPYISAVAKSAGIGGIFGLITNNSQSIAKNVLETAGTFAAFTAIAYPLIAFFKPILNKVGEITGNPKMSNVLNDPANPVTPNELWFRSPNDPTRLLKVTTDGLEYKIVEKVDLTGETGLATIEDVPKLTITKIEAFKENPSLYNQLIDWVKGKVTPEPVPFETIGETTKTEVNVSPSVEEKVQQATELGQKAFESGLTSTPASDPELMKLLEGLQTGEGTPIMKAWADAWHQANLKAPVGAEETKPLTITHFTKKENINSILTQGFDTTKAPIHGVGGLEGGPKTGKAGGDVLYFTTDNARWNKAQVYVGEGKGTISRNVYDYEKQKWVKEVNAYDKVNLSPIEAEVKSDAKILKIDGYNKALTIIQKGGKQFDMYGMIQQLIDAGKSAGFDIIHITNPGGVSWELPGGRTTKFGDKNWYKLLTGNSGNSDYFVLNKDVLTLKKPIKTQKVNKKGNVMGASPAIETTEPTVPKPKAPKVKQITLKSGLNPNIDTFIEDDIKPTVSAIKNGLVGTWDFIKKIFAPATRGDYAKMSAAVLRKELGIMARDRENVYKTLEKARKMFDKYSKEQALEVIDGIETGHPIAGTEEFAKVSKEVIDKNWNIIQAIKGSETYIENYFPHIWKDPTKAEETLAKYFGKKPLQGTKSFLKKRTIPTIKEGIAMGLEPTSYNPVDLIMAKIADMEKFIMAYRVMEQYKDMGLTRYVAFGKKAPTGWTVINDKVAKVYYKPTINEYYDTNIRNVLEEIAKEFGIDHKRVLAGQGLGKNLGVSFTGQKKIVTRFATPMDTLIHEIGHQIDEVFPYQIEKITHAYPKEIRALADLRWENTKVSEWFKDYVRKWEEKTAVMFQAHLYAPERFQEVAPKTYALFKLFLGTDPRLIKIRDIKKSLVHGSNKMELPYLVQSGTYYMPEEAATIVNNYISPGLTNNPLYNAMRMMGNTLNQVQLGFSAYHAMFTSADAVISKAALQLQQGKIINYLVSPILAPYYLWQNIVRGNKLLNDYYKQNPEMTELVNALQIAGGRVRMDSFYKNNAIENFLKTWRKGNYVGSLLRLPGAAIESAAYPILQWLVPRQKLGVFADGAKWILEKAEKEKWTQSKTILRLQEFWDSVDNRMGQLVYDNLFWNKVLKDLALIGVRSVGWNLGTIRELGGGTVQLATLPAKAGYNAIAKVFGSKSRYETRFTPKMAYTLSLPYIMGIFGAIIYYLLHGKAPEKLEDYYVIPTGKTKPDGSPEKILLASYMKDVSAWVDNPVQTVLSKLHPEVSAIADMLRNQDFLGVEIRNPNDPIIKQLEDLFKYQMSQFVPFSITNMLQRAKTDSAWSTYLQSFIGITPAPSYLTRDPLEMKIYDLYDLRFGGGVKSQAQKEIEQRKADVKTLYLLGKTDEANAGLKKLVDDGIVKDVSVFIENADLPNGIKLFRMFSTIDQENLLKGMELYQLNKYAWFASKDAKAAFSQMSANTRAWLELYNSGQVKEPKFIKGQMVEQ